ncbi:Crp/Fnr family transcriptional regulator [Sphingobacterium gobiense]|uniref:Transcriptional regulator n=1 Tax=Sphingobacterium gobiense TaxID=1382456 RepID=A0A2S9JLE4_9SPHI|nr:Crp/Fnr family transcriptional regulator [Sphingobacterium gobiense]PRD53975.1 transcriptional regulator [Sphingobacterium gobiense]
MSKKLKVCDHSCFMCRYVVPDWWENIDIRRQIIKVKKGQRFIDEGTDAEGVYFVQEGLVKVHKRWGDKESIVRFAKKGDIIGHRGMAREKSIFPISATCLENTILCFIPIDFFKSLLKTNPSLTYELLMFYADELQLSEQKVTNQAHLSVKGRLAWSFLLLEEKMGTDENGRIRLVLSKTDLAAYVGSTYESVYRMIAELEAEGAIEVFHKRIKIKDREILLSNSASLEPQ